MKEKLKGKVKRIRFSVNIIELFYSKQITYYTSSAQPLPSTFQTDADSDDLLDMINEFEETHGPPTDDSRLAAAFLPHTIRNQYLINEVIRFQRKYQNIFGETCAWTNKNLL